MKALIYILITLSLFGCKIDGTDTGNPGAHLGDAHTLPASLPTGSRLDELITNVCYQISICEAEILPNCFSSVYSLSNIDEEIGLSKGTYSDLIKVAKANLNNEISLNGSALDQCKTDLLALSCSLPEVVNSYDPTQTNQYDGVAAMLPTSCMDIFNSN